MSLKFRLFLGFVTVMALSACGGEPSEDDIRAAMQAQIDAANGQAMAMAGNNAQAKEMVKGMLTSLESVKKIACAKDGAGYKCDVTVTVNGLMGKQSTTTAMRLAKGDKGWVVSQ